LGPAGALASPARVAFYEFVTASLKAADALVTAYPVATALTPARHKEAMLARSGGPPRGAVRSVARGGDWRSAEPDKPSRSAAIRWLIGKGLKVEETRKK
jgi:hypothetical protein